MTDLAKQALDVVLKHALVSLQQHDLPHVCGSDLARLSVAINQKLGRNLGLKGDLCPLLLRWGHSQVDMHRSLTCCPERIEILQKIRPEWLAHNVNEFLIDLLQVGGHMGRVTPAWLCANVSNGNALLFCLGVGNHLDKVSPEWIAANVQHDMNKVAALIRGGHIHRVTPDWIFDNIAHYKEAFWALSEKMDVRSIPPAWFKRRVPCFEDFATVSASIGPMDSSMLRWFIGMYDSQYRDPQCAALDLASALMSINHEHNMSYGGCSFDIVELLTALRGIPYKELYGLLNEIREVTGIVELCEGWNHNLPRRDIIEMLLVQLGWSAVCEFDRLSATVVCQLILNKWAPGLM